MLDPCDQNGGCIGCTYEQSRQILPVKRQKKTKMAQKNEKIWKDVLSPKRKSRMCSSCRSRALIDPQEVKLCQKCDALFCCETCYLKGSTECCEEVHKRGQDQNWDEAMYDNILLVLKAITVLVVIVTVSTVADFRNS